MVECYKGYHYYPPRLAWACLCCVVLYPLLTFLALRRALPSVGSADKAWLTTWRNFVAGDFPAHRYWLYHVNQAAVLVLAVLVVFATQPSEAVQVRGGRPSVCCTHQGVRLLACMRSWWHGPWTTVGHH
jgi:hypothetical protein